MIRVKIETSSTTYRVADETHSASGSLWEGRLLNAPRLSEMAKLPLDSQQLRQIELSVANATDAGGHYIDISTEALWAARVTVEWDVGTSTRTWSGRIKRWSQDGEGTLSVTVAEDAQAVLGRLLPDEVVRLTSYSEAAREAANTTIPMVFGGSSSDPVRVRGLLVDRTSFRWLLCAGEIRQVVKVYADRREVTSGITTYTGTADQAVYPGFAFVQFASDPRDAAGRWPEIHADVVGLKLGTATETECRNPARVLKYLLTTPATGACGWGLGVSTSDIDDASFAQAIADCDAAGFRLDGALYFQQAARAWIDEILLACRGELYQTAAGKWGMRIDKPKTSAKAFTAANSRVLHFGRGSATDRINRVVLDYRYDCTDGMLLASQVRDDAASQSAIGVNERRVSALLLRDHATAGKIADYLLGVESYGEPRIELETADDCTGLSAGHRITVTREDLGLSDAAFVITRLVPGDFVTVIEARGYSDAIYGTTTPATPSDPVTDPVVPGPDAASPPAQPSGLSLSTGVVMQADGTALAYVEGSYTPGARTLFTTIEYGAGAAPTVWHSLSHDNTGLFRVNGLPIGTQYTFRLTAVNTGGSSTPITGTITTAADTTPPGTPGTPTLSVLFKSIRVRCFQNAAKAADLAGFRIYRNTTNDSGTAVEIGFQPCAGNEDGVVFLDQGTDYGQTYYYWTRAVDKSGNTSGFSPAAGPVTTAQVVSGDIGPGAISSPSMLGAGVVDAAAIAAGAVTAIKTCLAAIDSSTGCLNANVVGAQQIIDCAVTAAKTCLAAINRANGCLAAGAVNCPAVFGAGVVDAAAIANCAVTAVKTCLAAINNNSGCLNANVVGAQQIIAGSICTCHIVSGAVTTDKLAANSVVAGKIAAGAICGCHIAAATICGGNIMGCAIGADSIASDAVQARHICAGSVLAGKIAAGAICTCHIVSGAVTTDKLAANSVTASKLLIAAAGGNMLKNSAFDSWTGSVGAAVPVGYSRYDNSCDSYWYGATQGRHGRCAFTLCFCCNSTSKGILTSYGHVTFCAGQWYVASYYAKATCGVIGVTMQTAWNWNARPQCVCDICNPPLAADWQRYIFAFCWEPGCIVDTSAHITIAYGCNVCGSVSIADMQIEEGDVATSYKRGLHDGEIVATLIQDGAVTTDKLAANSVVAGKIAAGAICTCHLAAAGISADCITSGTINANLVTAACLRTGTVGGWEITPDHLSWVQCPGSFQGTQLILTPNVNNACFCAPVTGPFIGILNQDTSTGAYTSIGMGMALNNGITWYCEQGFFAFHNGSELFRVTKCMAPNTGITARIAGWNFNCTCLYSGNLVLDSAGAIRGNYTAGSAGWCIGANGCAELNNVTVRGTICSCSGQIGTLRITECGLCYLDASCCISTAGIMMAHLCYSSYLSCSAYAPDYGSGYRSAQAFVKSHYFGGNTYASFVVEAHSCCPYSYAGLTICASACGACSGPVVVIRSDRPTQPPLCVCGCNGGMFVCSTGCNGGIFCATTYTGVFGKSCYYGVYGWGTCCCAVVGNTAYGVVSSRHVKTSLRPACVLCDLRRLPIYRYLYHDRNLRGHTEHIGPTAEDFQAAFRLSFDDSTLPQLDGVALAAAKELDACVQAQEECILALSARLEALEKRLRN